MTAKIYEKNGYYYIVLYGLAAALGFVDVAVTDKARKWEKTGLTANKTNAKAAKAKMAELLAEYERKEQLILDGYNGSTVQFTDYLKTWLEHKKSEITQITYEGYSVYINVHIIPYFEPMQLTVADLRPKHILGYYQYKSTGGRMDGKEGGLGIRSLRSHALLIKAALNDAVMEELITNNPAASVKVPKRPTETVAQREVYMTAEEANKMLTALKNEPIYPIVYVAINYGLRRSEVLGLKWDAIDFEKNTIEIKHTVVKHVTTVRKDATKTKSSHNKFVLIPEVKALLQKIKAQQDANKKLCGNDYYVSDYVFTHDDGTLYRPDCLTKTFQRALKRHGLPKMRFHDLRHSTASVLYDKGWGIQDTKAWMRHADIETTSNIYTHISKTREEQLASQVSGTFKTLDPDDTNVDM